MALKPQSLTAIALLLILCTTFVSALNVTAESEQWRPKMVANNAVPFTLNYLDFGFNRIDVTVNTIRKAVRLKVIASENSPVEKEAPAVVLKYISFKEDRLEPEFVKAVKYQYRIEHTEFETHAVDSIKLYLWNTQNDSEWSEITPDKIENKSTYVQFTASASTLAPAAIVREESLKKTSEETKAPSKESTSEEPADNDSTETVETEEVITETSTTDEEVDVEEAATQTESLAQEEQSQGQFSTRRLSLAAAVLIIALLILGGIFLAHPLKAQIGKDKGKGR